MNKILLTLTLALPPTLLAVAAFAQLPAPQPTVYRVSGGYGYFYTSPTAAPTQWGLAGDTPFLADLDRDGLPDLIVYRPSTLTYYAALSGGGTLTIALGLPGDIPIVSDLDRDGATDLAVYRPSTGTWYYLIGPAFTTGPVAAQWGLPGDTPVPITH